MFKYGKLMKGLSVAAVILYGSGSLISSFLESNVGFFFFAFALFCMSVVGVVFLVEIFDDVFGS